MIEALLCDYQTRLKVSIASFPIVVCIYATAMYRRRAVVPVASSLLQAFRGYRIVPHLDDEIEELAESQKAGRWMLAHRANYQAPPLPSEIMCDKLNHRERRRSGTLPEKSTARKLSMYYAEDGVVSETNPSYTTKWMTITVVGLDGHPYKIRTVPMIDTTLNDLIDGCGIAHGWMNHWSRCNNNDCADWIHGDGCIVNVDLETLDKLPPPGRFEYYSLSQYRGMNRGDITYNTRFSCQLKVTEELDGGLFAMKNFFSRSLREVASDWGDVDMYATLSTHKCRKIEPWAPMLEEPTVKDFPFTFDMLWATDFEEIMKHKYPRYKRKDGFHTKPETWAAYV